MANQLDNIQILDGGLPRSIYSGDNIQITASLEVQSDVVVTGNLTVQGTLTSESTNNVRYADNHLYLNDGYTTAVAQTGGLVVNYLPIATSDSVDTGGFTAGVPATSNPTVKTVGSATFAVGQFIQVSGATDETNNGQFEVLTHVGTTLTIRGIGTTDTVEDFSQNQFVTDTTVAGTITRVNLSIMRSGTDGLWEVAAGATTPLTFTDLSVGGSDTLQTAYVAGNTITTSAGEGNVVITGTEQLLITTSGGINLDTQFDADTTVFDVLMAGSNGFSIDGTAASNVSVTSGNLTLSTVTTGTLIVNSVAALDMDAASATLDTTGAFSIDGAAASNVSVTGGNLSISTLTSGTLILNSVAALDMDGASATLDTTGSFSIDGAAASNVSTTAADLTLSTITSGALIATSAGLWDLNAGANLDIDVTGTYDMLSTGAFSIDGTGASNVSATSGNLSISTITTGTLILNSVAAIDMDGTSATLDTTGAFSIDGAAASNVSTTAADLTLSTITSGSLIATSAGLWDLNAGANLDIDVTGSYDMLSTGVFSIDGTGASNVSATSGNLTISTITTGTLILNSVAAIDMDGTSATLDTTGAFSIDGAAASNVSTTAADLTLSTITSGSLIATSAGLWDLNAGANLDIDVTGTYDMLSTGVFSIDGTGASNVSATSGNLTLSTITTGQLLLTSAGDSDYTVPNASATAFRLRDGTLNYLVVDSTDDSLDLSAPFTRVPNTGGIGFERTTDSALVAGDLVCGVVTTGNVKLADADTGSLRDGWVVGVSQASFSATSTARVFSNNGQIIPVRFAAAPASSNNGFPVYLSTTPGLGTLTAPSGGNDKVTFVVGILIGADGADTTPDVIWMPQFISKGATVTA
jgi:hypothetical protein